MTLAELFNESDDLVFLSGNEQELIGNYRCLPNEKASMLLGLTSKVNL